MKPVHVAADELDDLATVLGTRAAARLAVVPGGWRDLSENELNDLGLTDRKRRAVVALQRLVRHGYPELPATTLVRPEVVADVYGERLGGLRREVMLAVAVDGRCHPIAEIELASGGKHGMALTPADVLRPLIRAGASSFILVHNHPSGSPEPSPEDVEMTQVLVDVCNIVGTPLLDHIIVAGMGGGFTSLRDLGVVPEPTEKRDEPRDPDEALRAVADQTATGPARQDAELRGRRRGHRTPQRGL